MLITKPADSHLTSSYMHTLTTNDLRPRKTLTVYKASAGSGKTFRLAVEYIKLLLDNPKAYEGILAVTFTNKATEEMKMRILSQLYGIWKGLPDSEAYINEVTHGLGIGREEASRRAEKSLHLLLHNYHFFRVQTIDTFFQTVLRNLAKELQLNAGLRVGLNNQQVVEQAVDEMIDSLADDKKLMRIVMNYVEDNLSEDKAWNVIGQIKRFGGTIFRELYKQNRKRMDAVFSDQDFFDNYKKTLRDIISSTEEKYAELGKEALKLTESAGLSIDDFQYKNTGPMSYFIKLSKGVFRTDEVMTKRVEAAMQDISKWVTKTSKKQGIILPFVEDILMPIITKAEAERETDACLHDSAKVTLKHINDIRLLRKIEETAHSLNETAQRFMLSDTQSLLHEIIDEGDSAFIFEKIGSRLEHVMIDEFQDTSTIQWANFKPLLHECMSQGFSNLIVGDVKQSIYRFRNGDWRLLNDIDTEFSGSDLEFPPIKTNRRSDRNVINFNNTFFNIVAKLEVNGIMDYSKEKAASLNKAYADVEQDIPEERPPIGLVHIEMLPHDQIDDMPERTLQNILDLISLGVRQQDIAILVRKGKEIPVLAQYIETNSEGKIKVVSAEAFRLDASAAVRIIINAMTVLAHPQDNIALASLVTDYYTSVMGDEETLAEAFAGDNRLQKLLPKEFTENGTALLSMSIHGMAEALMRIFSLERCTKETAYITAFFDCIQDFSNEMSPVLEDFITTWNDDLAQKTIQATDCNGVRILTIHKSKGLEFKHVILPYCNWSGNPPHTVIWASPKVKPFSELPIVPLDYLQAGTLEGTIYEEDGYNEHIQNVVDNLNLLYVAMTRAGHSLFIIGERNKKNFTRSQVICEAIELLPERIDGMDVHVDGMDDEETVLSVTYGKIAINEERKAISSNVFLPDIEQCGVTLQSYKTEAEFRQSGESRRFAQDAMDENDRQRMIRMGTVLHQLFATIRTTADIEPVLQRMEFDGTLYDKEITKEKLAASLKAKFNDTQVQDWFSGRWKVYNERCIITKEGYEYRPDRVVTDGNETIVIDFKFGNKEEKHKKQVREYMALLKEMDMPDVQGFLWYVTTEQIEEVC